MSNKQGTVYYFITLVKMIVVNIQPILNLIERFLHSHIYLFDLNQNVITPSSGEMTDHSLLMYDGLLQTFSPLKPRPFLTIDCKLAFRYASIQSTTDR